MQKYVKNTPLEINVIYLGNKKINCILGCTA
jgi:hypothetical protein